MHQINDELREGDNNLIGWAKLIHKRDIKLTHQFLSQDVAGRSDVGQLATKGSVKHLKWADVHLIWWNICFIAFKGLFFKASLWSVSLFGLLFTLVTEI